MYRSCLHRPIHPAHYVIKTESIYVNARIASVHFAIDAVWLASKCPIKQMGCINGMPQTTNQHSRHHTTCNVATVFKSDKPISSLVRLIQASIKAAVQSPVPVKWPTSSRANYDSHIFAITRGIHFRTVDTVNHHSHKLNLVIASGVGRILLCYFLRTVTKQFSCGKIRTWAEGNDSMVCGCYM